MPDHPPTRPRPAYEQPSFLESDEARPLRILAEYLEPLDRLARAGIHDTIVFFGSARLKPDGPLGHYYDEARELTGSSPSGRSRRPPTRIASSSAQAAAGGIMEAANCGASDAAGKTIGLDELTEILTLAQTRTIGRRF